MSNLIPYASSGALSARDARRLARVRSDRSVSRELRGQDVDVETDVAIDKVQNVTMATGAAMTAIVNVATAQQNLEQLAPAASGRLALLADSHALEMAETLADLRLRLRRL